MLGGDQPPQVEVTLSPIPPESSATVRGVSETLGVYVLVTTVEEAVASATTEGGDGGNGGNGGGD